MDLFSFIVPVYNVEEYLGECIDSLIQQTYRNLEIVLVDDGSPDNSGKICDEYALKDKRIKVIHKKNGGPSSARNAGLDIVTGKYIWFVDSDDYIAKDAVEQVISKMQEENVDILLIQNYRVEENKVEVCPYKFDHKGIPTDQFYIVQFPSACEKIFQRELFQKNRFRDGIIYEDLALIPGLVNQTKRIGILDKPLYYYRMREGSIMKAISFNPKVDEKYIALSDVRKSFIEANNSEKYANEIEYIHIKHLLITYSREIMKYKKEIYKDRIEKAFAFMKQNFPHWEKNKYLQMEPLYTRVYLQFLKKKFYFGARGMSAIAAKILK